jgi:hypothetical protein
MIVRPHHFRHDWFTWRDPPREWYSQFAEEPLPGLIFGAASNGIIVDFHQTHLPCMPDEVRALAEAYPLPAPPPLPTDLLRPYQLQVRNELGGFRGVLLAMEMRTGKTPLACHLHDPALGPLIVIAPLAAREAWKDWVGRTFNWPLQCLATFNTEQDMPDLPAYFCHYEILGEHAPFLLRQGVGTLVLDEIHCLQGMRSNRVQAVALLVAPAKKILGLSGTPMWNKPKSMWQLLHFLTPGAWGTAFEFKRRYCLPRNAPILMSDLTERPISEVRVGDKVIGWSRSIRGGANKQSTTRGFRRLCEAEVLAVFKREAPLVRVVLDNKQELICTEDHLWLTGYSGNGQQAREYSKVRPGVVGGVGSWSASRILHLADGIPAPPDNALYRKGYLIGAFRGDGWCTRTRKERLNAFRGVCRRFVDSYRVGMRVRDAELIDRVAVYLKAFGLKFNRYARAGYFGVALDRKSGFDFFSTPFSRLRGSRAALGRARRGTSQREPKSGSALTFTRETREWWRGFLAGMYDAEGSGERICQYRKVNGPTYKLICLGLDALGFKYRRDPEAVRILGGRLEMERFWRLVSPALLRKARSFFFNKGGKFKGSVRYVTHVYPLPGRHPVFTLKTTTGNYVAYGCGSKNCDAQPGAHGWTYEGITHNDELRARIGYMTARLTWKDVAPDLPPTTRTFEPVSLTAKQYADLEAAAMKATLAKGTSSAAGYFANLRRKAGMLKVKPAVEAALHSAEDGHKVVLWAWHNEVLDKLEGEFAEEATYSSRPWWTLRSSDSVAQREVNVDEFRRHDGPAFLVASMGVGGVGLDLSCSDHAIFVELDWTPAMVYQAEMRTFHKDRPQSVTYFYTDDPTETKLIAALDAKNGFANALGLGSEDIMREVLK